jgi:hypothetical protein
MPMSLLEPRGALTLRRITLAKRADRAALARGPILFYDNTKMDVGHYGLILPRIKQGLQARGFARFTDYRATIRGKTSDDIAALAEQFSRMDLAGAVLALADMGVSPAMIALTVAMERMGIPTVCLTAGPGSTLAVAHAHYRAGSLCLIPLDIYHASDELTVTTQADRSVERLVPMLTVNGAELEKIAAIDYPVDRAPASPDGCLSSGRVDCEAAYDRFEELHIGDGLPVVPPTRQRYEAMREYCPFDPDEIIVSDVGPSGTAATVKDALIAAVMAGCKPQYMPIVVTALRAISRPQYGLLQAVTTSFAGGHFVLVSGPLAAQLGVHGGQGCLGPGFRANATIGRAINLLLLNVCRPVPGYADLACLSSPA